MSQLEGWTHMCGMEMVKCNKCNYYVAVEEEETKKSDKKSKKFEKAILAREIRATLMSIQKYDDERVQKKILRRFKKWFKTRSSHDNFTKEHFLILWKIFFDFICIETNLLIQEELVKLFSELVHCLKTRETIILYITCALQTFATKC
ncbi:hypothetical protein ALC56_08289 [Trachymyrmex septentrionalis]|uniref:Uncharacterized protein n=1 Tax=Trachymyrmex septentrionalis TaxID=34720 RepID=A0A151JVD5_9HYME|nr:hypothetical protein ALC56_08289 [Trachymyrmex septentrionalis]